MQMRDSRVTRRISGGLRIDHSSLLHFASGSRFSAGQETRADFAQAEKARFPNRSHADALLARDPTKTLALNSYASPADDGTR